MQRGPTGSAPERERRREREREREREKLIGTKLILYLFPLGHLPVLGKAQATGKLGTGQLLRVRENSNALSSVRNLVSKKMRRRRVRKRGGVEEGRRRGGEGEREEKTG